MSSKTSRWLNNILLMVSIVTKEEYIQADELCERMGVSREELEGDIQALNFSGTGDMTPYDMISAEIDEDGYVHIEMAGGIGRRPLKLTLEEGVIIQAGCEALMKSGFRGSEALSSALGKIQSQLQDRMDDVEEIVGRIDLTVGIDATEDWQKKIRQALDGGKNLKIEYYTESRDDFTDRVVEPVALRNAYGYWYLTAWCYLRNEQRVFKLNRIKSMKIVPRKESHACEVKEQAIGEAGIGKQSHHVKLVMDEKSGREIAEEIKVAKVTENPNGSVTVRINTKNLEWLSNYLLKFGDSCTVESPTKLFSMVKENRKRVKALYGR